MYSALKVDGVRLYDLARQGKEVERKERDVTISSIDLLSITNERLILKVNCSKGTYIRVLCEDIAIKLETCGYMKSLLRTRVGKFKIEDQNKVIDIENILENRIDIKNSDLILSGIFGTAPSYERYIKLRKEFKNIISGGEYN